MKITVYLLGIAFVGILMSCQNPGSQDTDTSIEEDSVVIGNPPMPGFDLENSDEKAIEIADNVMEAMGGRQNWEETQYTTWVFFGNRKHVWDKHTGDVRIDYLQDTTHNKEVILNVQSMEGKVQMDGELLADADSAQKLIEAAHSNWINDMYWVFMPFKLKDTGVTLKYMGQDSTKTGEIAEVLQLTFSEVGVTPQNKYLVYVDPNSHYVTQWDYYPNSTDEAPRFSSSWENYEQHGDIMLSGDRNFYDGGMRQITEIAVMDSLPETVFMEFGEMP